MPDLDIGQRHANAILALLAAAPPAGTPLVVHDGKVPKTADNPATEYVLVYFVTTMSGISSMTGASDLAVTYAYCHCVGVNAVAARAIAGRVRTALLNQKPVISGATVWPIRDNGGSGPQPDKDEATGRLVMDQVAVYRLESSGPA